MFVSQDLAQILFAVVDFRYFPCFELDFQIITSVTFRARMAWLPSDYVTQLVTILTQYYSFRSFASQANNPQLMNIFYYHALGNIPPDTYRYVVKDHTPFGSIIDHYYYPVSYTHLTLPTNREV